jgi:hypothetical protein
VRTVVGSYDIDDDPGRINADAAVELLAEDVPVLELRVGALAGGS